MSSCFYGEIRLVGFDQPQLEEIFQAVQLKAFSQGKVAGVELILEKESEGGVFKPIEDQSRYYDLLEINKLVRKDAV